MGMKYPFATQIGGGYPSFIPAPVPPFLPILSPLCHQITSKSNEFEYFFGVVWCFVGKIGDSEERKPNKYLVLVWF